MNNLKFRAFQKSTQTMLPTNSLKAICTTSDSLTEEEYDDLIIMQSTGLFDKNGKVIFEGDIAKCQKDIFEIKMNDYGRFSGFCLNNTRYNNIHGVYMFDFISVNKTNLKIIGNIYENPELLNS